MLPIVLPLKISDRACCALLAIGSAIRLYDLSSKRLVMERNLEDFFTLIDMQLSANGRFFAVTGMSWASIEAARQQGTRREAEARGIPHMEIRVYSVDEEDPLRTLVFPVLHPTLATVSPLGASSGLPMAIDSQGRRLVMDTLDMPPESDSTVLPYRNVAVIDVASGKPDREFFSEPWMPRHPTDFPAMLKTRTAAFSADGRSIAIRQTEAECPASTPVHPMTMMPLSMPSCWGMRVKYTVWDLRSGQMSAEIEDITESGVNDAFSNDSFLTALKSASPPRAPAASAWTQRTQQGYRDASRTDTRPDELKPKGTGTSDRTTPTDVHDQAVAEATSRRLAEEGMKLNLLLGGGLNMPGIPGLGLAPAPVAFTLDADTAVTTTRVEIDSVSGRMVLVTERLDGTGTSLLQEVCHRMAPKHQEFSPEQWALKFPGANFHPICASTVPHQ